MLKAQAQSITPIHTFSGSDGANPIGSLTLGPDNYFYGTTSEGGTNGSGTVFRVDTNGTLTTIYTFSEVSQVGSMFENNDGAFPSGQLTLGPHGKFYGTTQKGGMNGVGTVFRVTTNGVLTTIYTFSAGVLIIGDGYDNLDGAYPYAGIIFGADGDIYGTTYDGDAGEGGVFRLTTNGSLSSVQFNGGNGANPCSWLTLGPDGNFYGTTYGGGRSGDGTVFQVTTNLTLTTIASFDGVGGNPYAGLTLGPDGNFYGTTLVGDGYGMVFQVTTNGSLSDLASPNTLPYSGLTLGPDGNFYGTTSEGGSYDNGSIFQVTTNGGFTVLASFAFNGSNGTDPRSAPILGPDGNFYGVTEYGGGPGNGSGVIYRLNLPPEILRSPASQKVYTYDSVSFNTSVYAAGSFAYQWLFNGSPLSGATNATLTLASVSANDAGDYWVIVSNSWGSTTSASAVLNVASLPPYGAQVFFDTFDPTIATGYNSHVGTDSTGGSTAVVAGSGVNGTAALRIQSSFTNGPTGSGSYTAEWQDGMVSGNPDQQPSRYVLSFDALVTGDAAHQSGGGFKLMISETAGASYSTPFPQGTLTTFRPSQGGVDLTIPQTGVWKHFTINLGGPQFQGTSGADTNFNPSGATWQINFQMNSADWGTEPQTNSTLAIDNLALNLLVPPSTVGSPVIRPDRNIELTFSTSTNFSSRMLLATNLAPPVTWVPVYTNFNGGTWLYVDTNAAAFRTKFYQVSTP